MSTPISSTSSAGLQGAPISSATTSGAGQASPSKTATQLDEMMLMAEAPVVSLAAAASSASQLEAAFGHALQNATSVDPSTGQREVSTSADSQLSAALNSFLVQSGFSQQQADAASVGFAAQLAKGGPVDLNASFAETDTTASSVSASYGSQTMSASSVAVNTRSGSVSIAFDPSTGGLSISMGEQRTSTTTSIEETSGPGLLLALPSINIQPLLAGQGQDNNAGVNDTSDSQAPGAASNGAAASSNANGSLQRLIAGLMQPKLHGAQEAGDMLGRMAKAGQQDGVTAKDSASTGDQSTAAPVAATIGFTQPMSVAMHDLNGHGATLFKRPDGSTGAMSFEPTSVEA